VGEIYIGDQAENSYVAIDHIWFNRTVEGLESRPNESFRIHKTQILKNDLSIDDMSAKQALKVSLNETRHSGIIPLIETQDYTEYTEYTDLWRRVAKEIPYSFVPTQFVSMDGLAKLWDRITATPNEVEMNAALKIIDDNFQQLTFVKPVVNLNRKGPKWDLEYFRAQPRSDRIAVVKLKTSPRRLPLGSMGDGMSRTLQYVLAVFRAKNGILLIDEFENGLHWQVQEKIWQMLFKLARDLNIQIFATTHSEDTIKAFSTVAQSADIEGVLIKLVRKPTPDNNGKVTAVIYEKEVLNTAVLTETEIR
jgi:AAA15 family ATPase/GTPase